jgi:hypothetical protein
MSLSHYLLPLSERKFTYAGSDVSKGMLEKAFLSLLLPTDMVKVAFRAGSSKLGKISLAQCGWH